MFVTGLTQPQLLANVQTKLLQLRNALESAADLQAWASGIAATDLEALNFTASDAAALLSAIADAGALASIYNTGLPPGTYPQPASAYVYGASQRNVIGPN